MVVVVVLFVVVGGGGGSSSSSSTSSSSSSSSRSSGSSHSGSGSGSGSNVQHTCNTPNVYSQLLVHCDSIHPPLIVQVSPKHEALEKPRCISEDNSPKDSGKELNSLFSK